MLTPAEYFSSISYDVKKFTLVLSSFPGKAPNPYISQILKTEGPLG